MKKLIIFILSALPISAYSTDTAISETQNVYCLNCGDTANQLKALTGALQGANFSGKINISSGNVFMVLASSVDYRFAIVSSPSITSSGDQARFVFQLIDPSSHTEQGNNFSISTDATAMALILSSSGSIWLLLDGSTNTKLGGINISGSLSVFSSGTFLSGLAIDPLGVNSGKLSVGTNSVTYSGNFGSSVRSESNIYSVRQAIGSGSQSPIGALDVKESGAFRYILVLGTGTGNSNASQMVVVVTTTGQIGVGGSNPSSGIDIINSSLTVRGTNAGASINGPTILSSVTVSGPDTCLNGPCYIWPSSSSVGFFGLSADKKTIIVGYPPDTTGGGGGTYLVGAVKSTQTIDGAGFGIAGSSNIRIDVAGSLAAGTTVFSIPVASITMTNDGKIYIGTAPAGILYSRGTGVAIASGAWFGPGYYMDGDGSTQKKASGGVLFGAGTPSAGMGPVFSIVMTSFGAVTQAVDAGIAWYSMILMNDSAGGSTGVGIKTKSPTNALSVNGAMDVSGNCICGGKPFKIPDPLNENFWLYHAVTEGPEFGTYYRGEAQLANGSTTIFLPSYFELLNSTDSRTVQLTNVGGYSNIFIDSAPANGKFTVKTDINGNKSQRFYWQVNARRHDPHVLDPQNGLTDGDGRLRVEIPISEEIKNSDVMWEMEKSTTNYTDPITYRRIIQRKRSMFLGYGNKYNIYKSSSPSTYTTLKPITSNEKITNIECVPTNP